MAEKGKQAPSIIIVKKKGGHGGHHGGAWKVAYADFVTAMMAFFLVMWLVAQSTKVKENIAQYFTDPAAYNQKVKAGLLEGGVGVLDSSGSQFVVIKEADQGSGSGEGGDVNAALEQAGREVLTAMTEVPDLQQLANQIDVEITKEGLRIQLLESADSSFFDSGSANLSPSGLKAVQAIASVVRNLNMDMAVEGHTDSRPFGADRGNYTNWELSADRANAARRVLEAGGVSSKHVVEVRGYGATHPKYPENPEDSRNRRVSIIVFNRIYAQQAAESGKAGRQITPLPLPDDAVKGRRGADTPRSH
jgi:chemotaxis protein MotB